MRVWIKILHALAIVSLMGATAGATVGHAITPAEPNNEEIATPPLRVAVISDRTGGHRPGVFENAMAKLELMQPDIVLSIGDLIEGYVEDEAEIARQWDKVEKNFARFGTRFHAVPGNHDYSNAVQAKIWRERRGPPYWSFMVGDVLFLGLSTEDPPVPLPDSAKEGHIRLQQAMAADPVGTQQRILESTRSMAKVPKPGDVAISAQQVDYFRDILTANPNPRWIFMVMHKPAWNYDNAQFDEILDLIGDRSFTAIAGHEHYYGYKQDTGHDFLTLSTTGGVWLKDGPGRVDHFLWVTVGKGEPSFANIRIDGIFPKTGLDTPVE